MTDAQGPDPIPGEDDGRFPIWPALNAVRWTRRGRRTPPTNPGRIKP